MPVAPPPPQDSTNVRRDEFLRTVTQDGDFGWQFVVTSPGGSVQTVTGPNVAPIGNGSVRLFAPVGDLSAEVRLPTFNLTPVEQLTDLRYWTFDQVNNGSQWPYISSCKSTLLGTLRSMT
jgi:hypothetical protein